MNKTQDYRTLEEIRQRKNELRLQIDRDSERIGRLWGSIFVKREESTKGQFIASILSHGAMAIDTFLMVRKLRKNYSGLMKSLHGKKS